MKTLGAILGSAARTDILRVLYYQPDPVGLRYLARIAGVHPHSAELALEKLIHDGLVVYNQIKLRKLYELNSEHLDTAILKSVFDASEHVSIKLRNNNLNKRATCILPFIAEASYMISHARRCKHVT